MRQLQKTPVYPLYEKYGAKVVNFHGWAMPVQFSGILREHSAVRTDAGLFDISHMGEIVISGVGTCPFLQKMITNDISKQEVGQAVYTAMCNEDGGTVDDFVVYRLAEDRYLLVVNATNIEKDEEWLKKHAGNMSRNINNCSHEVALLALQGPRSEEILQRLTSISLSGIKPFRFARDVDIGEVHVLLVSRTGYTGEDGFELYLRSTDAKKLWEKILEEGASFGLLPCGLGARDTLRFEAGLPLYGQELSSEISPIEASLDFAVKWGKGDFVGREALLRQKEEGLKRKLVGLEMLEKGIPRTGYPVFAGSEMVGIITSGMHAPTLKKNLGLALVQSTYAVLGQELTVEVRGKRLAAKVVKKPFYKRSMKKSLRM